MFRARTVPVVLCARTVPQEHTTNSRVCIQQRLDGPVMKIHKVCLVLVLVHQKTAFATRGTFGIPRIYIASGVTAEKIRTLSAIRSARTVHLQPIQINCGKQRLPCHVLAIVNA